MKTHDSQKSGLALVPRPRAKKRFGIVGGLGALAGADLFFKLVRLMPSAGRENYDIIMEQHPFAEGEDAGNIDSNHSARKLYVFDTIKSFERRRVESVILPCFISHTFLDEMQDEIRLPVVNIMDALAGHVRNNFPRLGRLGVLTSDYVARSGLFARYFSAPQYELIYPKPSVQRECFMPAIYGACGIKAGYLQHDEPLNQLYRSCRDLLDQGAELILPGVTEISLVIEQLREMGIPILDPNQVYARYAAEVEGPVGAKSFKVGIVGGVGPAATVDFMNKIIRNTPATRDQEHIKMVVENNPQIPDRTGNLLGDGADPTIALYATCKKLEAGDADLIAIPCNTAHAFVARIQPYLGIPILNMLQETRGYIASHFSSSRPIGLLATSGTIESRVYHDAFAGSEFQLLVPDQDHQAKVMAAIYGEQGVKAGYTEGVCRGELLEALHHLVERGAESVILGCTELPLIFTESSCRVQGREIPVLDPTEILAIRCAAIGAAWRRNALPGGTETSAVKRNAVQPK